MMIPYHGEAAIGLTFYHTNPSIPYLREMDRFRIGLYNANDSSTYKTPVHYLCIGK